MFNQFNDYLIFGSYSITKNKIKIKFITDLLLFIPSYKSQLRGLLLAYALCSIMIN